MPLRDVQRHECKQKVKKKIKKKIKRHQQILYMEEIEQKPRKKLTYLWELRKFLKKNCGSRGLQKL